MNCRPLRFWSRWFFEESTPMTGLLPNSLTSTSWVERSSIWFKRCMVLCHFCWVCLFSSWCSCLVHSNDLGGVLRCYSLVFPWITRVDFMSNLSMSFGAVPQMVSQFLGKPISWWVCSEYHVNILKCNGCVFVNHPKLIVILIRPYFKYFFRLWLPTEPWLS